MAIEPESSLYMSWEQMQQLQLPPNTTVLIPPTPPVDDTVPLHPPAAASWLDDGYFSAQTPVAEDKRAAEAAREREQYGDPAVRLLTSLIATNALLEHAKSPPAEKAEKQKKSESKQI
jgi:hypothetical protein